MKQIIWLFGILLLISACQEQIPTGMMISDFPEGNLEVDIDSIDMAVDGDLDGVLNDLCPNTPEGQGVNSQGCSCSEIVFDDDNICTDDICENGVVKHIPNGMQVEFVECPSSGCVEDQMVAYSDSGYSYCQNGEIVVHQCEIIDSVYDYECWLSYVRPEDWKHPQVVGGSSASPALHVTPQTEPTTTTQKETPEVPEFTAFGAFGAIIASLVLYFRRK